MLSFENQIVPELAESTSISQRALFLDYLAQTSDAPLMLEIKSAEGIYLKGRDGKKYIDLISGIGVSNVGHRHPHVLRAIRKQLKSYLHVMVYGEYVQSPQVNLAKRLVATLPESLDNVYLVNSGTEAIEGALKLAKRFTGRTEMISCFNAYHGSTHGALSMNGSEYFKNAYRPLLPDIKHIRFNEINDLENITQKTACVLIETVQGEAGVRVPTKEYLQKLRQKCTETGTLLILDEIQAGFGRTGKFWAFEHFGIVPDILVCAKGMGGGMPIGAFISSKKIMSVLTHNPVLGHITTFGGHPVSCAASLATIRIILRQKLHEKVAEKEQLFREMLIHPRIKEIRSLGLMMALQFENFSEVKSIIDKAISYGVITDWFLYCDSALRIAPPLTINKNQIRDVCGILLKAMSKK
ncbi:Acetylornithine/succinyldiaminopimelate/putrescine aminotransferase [Thermoflexibacter ruber]|uniref:Acetylornithine/succinyldiaminopimelate/putrescine aminotransferase n=1 Tax=Thermoflexibacter ruber TaxID=1003 RepID=A0A1I2EB13_9BACT|nr:Acetylornithine/succinyldiaminopimelate/putrescine aminotransferase [Thermoflexibacter ruber]